jgi:hypothetical protein
MEPGMLNENQNNPGWKNKLEDTVDLANETCRDKNALWQKLDDRLNEKPRRKRFGWYWAAAACLMVTMLLPFIKNNIGTNGTNPNVVVKQQPAAPKTSEIAKAPAPAHVDNSSIIIEKRQAVKVAKQEKVATNVQNAIVPEPGIASTSPIVQNDIQPVQNVITPITNTPVVVATAGPVLKQKLKVIHINELGYTEEITHREEHIADYRSVRFNPVSPITYTTTSSTQNISDLNFFKTKTSPSN